MTSFCTDSPVSTTSTIATTMPRDCVSIDTRVVHSFRSIKQLRTAMYAVLASLENKESTDQWVLVIGLSQNAITRLDEDHSCLGINYRFQWNGTKGLIKVIPTAEHETVTTRMVLSVNDALSTMGLDWGDAEWVGTTTYKRGVGTGQQPDNAFVPPSRCTTPVRSVGWPTLVIETGMSESLSQLRDDAKKWFADSNGNVRIVLLVAIKACRVDIEKWQLAPAGAPTPLTRLYISSLCRQNPNVPPLSPLSPTTQQPYCAQEIVITPQGIVGTPLVLNFHALYDRAPGQGETDILITSADCLKIIRRLW